MGVAKKAILEDANIKVLVWGEPGSGKSRFGLSAPNPLVVDLEGSTRLYANEFDFWVATINMKQEDSKTSIRLVKTIIDEINAGEYPEVKTLVIDPITDLLDDLESTCAIQYEKKLGKIIDSLNALQKTKWYAFRREYSRKVINELKNLPLNLILVARSKAIWAKGSDGQMTPVGETYDALPIVESLMDIVINLKKSKQNEYIAEVKKSRLGNLPDILEIKSYDSICMALKEAKNKP